jgi:hypothetical protein
MNSVRPTVLALFVCAAIPVLAADASERKFTRDGMGEGEVLFKIGKPDHEAFVRSERGQPEEKTWTCFPHSREPNAFSSPRSSSACRDS